MPPRSVCLNVFTTSLSNGIPKESNVSVKEVDADVNMKEMDVAVTERARHDSVQGSPNDTVTSAPYSVSVTAASSPVSNDTGCGIATLRAQHAAMSSLAHVRPSVCQTCGQAPAPGNSLQRCSRCKSVYYCSKSCQKAAWKTHRTDCGSSSAIGTPNISTPGSPTNVQELSATVEISSYMRRVPQSTMDWAQSSGSEDKLRLSFSDSIQYDDLRDLLICGYCVHATENGGVAPTRVDLFEEFKSYVAAASERVDTDGILDEPAAKDQLHDEVANALENGTSPLLKEVTAAEVMELYGADVLKDVEQIRKAVYGA